MLLHQNIFWCGLSYHTDDQNKPKQPFHNQFPHCYSVIVITLNNTQILQRRSITVLQFSHESALEQGSRCRYSEPARRGVVIASVPSTSESPARPAAVGRPTAHRRDKPLSFYFHGNNAEIIPVLIGLRKILLLFTLCVENFCAELFV